jgi:hypothetical protein
VTAEVTGEKAVLTVTVVVAETVATTTAVAVVAAETVAEGNSIQSINELTN